MKTVAEKEADYMNEVLFYLKDSLESITLVDKDVTKQPLQLHHALHHYFNRLVRCDVTGREYAFINATPFTRQCFIYLCEEPFQDELRITPQVEINGLDLYELLRHVCPDLPYGLIESMASYMIQDEQKHDKAQEISLDALIGDEEGAMRTMCSLTGRLESLLDAFYIYFYYQEFFRHIEELFLTSSNATRRERKQLLAQLDTIRDKPGMRARCIDSATLEAIFMPSSLEEEGMEDTISMMTAHEVIYKVLKDGNLAASLKKRKPLLATPTTTRSKRHLDKEANDLFAKYYASHAKEGGEMEGEKQGGKSRRRSSSS